MPDGVWGGLGYDMQGEVRQAARRNGRQPVKPPRAPRGKRFSWKRDAFIVVAVVAIGTAAVWWLISRVDTGFAVDVGDCVEPPDATSPDLQIVSCDQPHRYEVVAVWASNGDEVANTGGVSVSQAGRDACRSHIDSALRQLINGVDASIAWAAPITDPATQGSDRYDTFLCFAVTSERTGSLVGELSG